MEGNGPIIQKPKALDSLEKNIKQNILMSEKLINIYSAAQYNNTFTSQIMTEKLHRDISHFNTLLFGIDRLIFPTTPVITKDCEAIMNESDEIKKQNKTLRQKLESKGIDVKEFLQKNIPTTLHEVNNATQATLYYCIII
jgi:hypothetical protein